MQPKVIHVLTHLDFGGAVFVVNIVRSSAHLSEIELVCVRHLEVVT